MPLIELGEFKSHSGIRLPWKINCDALTDEDINAIAKIIADKIHFGAVYGIPRGGTRLASALETYLEPGSDISLIVDDVLTTGKSMEEAKERLIQEGAIEPDPVGVVIFARGDYPRWVQPIFIVDRWMGLLGSKE